MVKIEAVIIEKVKLSSYALVGLLLLSIVEAPYAQKSPTAASASPNEIRALWVVRTTLTSPQKIRTMVSAAADNGFNTLIVQVRGRGDAYYK